MDTIKTQNKLDTGIYDVEMVAKGTAYVLEVKINSNKETVKAHQFQDKEKLDLLVESFFDKRVINKMSELGFLHKVGVLLYGKEGTGKSSIIKYYLNKMIKDNDAICFYINGVVNLKEMWDFIIKIRAIQNNSIVVIFEEFDGLIKHNHEPSLKNYLDGNGSIDNCFIFATTNYIERIPDALKNRPSRFKYVLNVEGITNKIEIYDILFNMIGDMFEKDEIELFSEELVGSSLDIIKQFAIDKIMNLTTYQIKTKKEVGFGRNKLVHRVEVED